ncbi:MAG: hypothetical protein PHE54_05545 [Bacilli bacterium]|nr:hypothetical protein [Bacilli bacterium]
MQIIIIFFFFISRFLYDGLKFLFPFILILLLLFMLKLFLRIRKYGLRELKFTTKDNSGIYKELILENYLKRIPNSKFYKPDQLETTYLFLTNNNIYLIYYYKETGYIYGDINSKMLTKRINLQNNKAVINPYFIIENDVKIISKLTSHIKKIIIIENNCLIKYKDNTIKYKYFFDDFKKILKAEKQNKDFNIDKFYQLLNKM